MATEMDPIVNNWYRDLETRRIFEIVALDEDDGTIEIQYFESEIEELDTDIWYDLSLELIAQPEDWSGPYDVLVADDFSDSGEPMRPESWNNPADDVERVIEYE